MESLRGDGQLGQKPTRFLFQGSATFRARPVQTCQDFIAALTDPGLFLAQGLDMQGELRDQTIEAMTPQKLINPKALSAVIRDFFGRSQLSQFMDNTPGHQRARVRFFAGDAIQDVIGKGDALLSDITA